MSIMLRPPSLGPIVGHTTTNSARIWIRGADIGEHRTVGVAALFSDQRQRARYFRLHREYDRTGWIDFKNLDPEKEYRVRTGSLYVDSVDSDVSIADGDVFDRLPPASKWIDDLRSLPDQESEARFETFPQQIAKGDRLSFVFGSCRYPGIFWQSKRADAIYGAIHERFANPGKGTKPRFLLMVGDQIYADLFNRLIPIGRADTEDEFHERYMTAFGSRNMRKLLRHVPTYMILDDHEIEDNWVQGRVKRREQRVLFNLAIAAYMSYQWTHSPRSFGKKLFYKFDCAGYPFFVMDGRTQRMRDDDDQRLEDNHMLGFPRQDYHAPGYMGQIDHLCQWLAAQQASNGKRPKFVVSPSVFVPNTVVTVPKDKRWKSDSWPAFPDTRSRLLKTIVDHKVQNVIFLSGDVHCSNVAEIWFHKANAKRAPLDLKAFSITSSAFYWPFPFADGDPLSFVHDSEKQNDEFTFDTKTQGKVAMHYKAKNFEQDDNFTQVDFNPAANTITATNFDKKGKQLRQSKLTLA